MNDVVHAYQPNGHKSWSLYLPAHILAMCRMEVTSARMTKALVLALANGTPRRAPQQLRTASQLAGPLVPPTRV
jgi:hypothetical protein